MLIALALFLFILALAFHEVGHALAMRKYGVTVKTLGIGLPIFPKLTLNIGFTRRIFGEQFRIVLSPWIIGAYVEPLDRDCERHLSPKQLIHVYGAGAIGNIALAFFIFSVMVAIGTAELSLGESKVPLDALAGTTIFFSLGILVIVFSRQISIWVFPIVAFLVLWILVDFLISRSLGEIVDSSGGPVLMGELATKHAINLNRTMLLGCLVSVALGIGNLLPFYPLDGGRIIQAIIRKFAPVLSAPFETGGIVVFVLLLGISLGSDIIRIIS